MEVLKVITNVSWPFAAMVVGAAALFLFGKPLLGFLSRARDLSVAGIRVSANPQDQRALEQPKTKVDEILKSFESPLLTEQEQIIRTEIDRISSSQEEREKVLVRALATSQIHVTFERTYLSIFGSQITSLQFLSSLPTAFASQESLRPFYATAQAQSPKFYANYSFDQWLGFLQSQVLVVRQGDMVGITVRGKEFLKYLIDQGYTMHKGA